MMMFDWKYLQYERFAHPDKYSWGVSCEYLPVWPETNEEEIIRLCLFHTIFINEFLKLYVPHTKKMSQFQTQPAEVLYKKSTF